MRFIFFGFLFLIATSAQSATPADTAVENIYVATFAIKMGDSQSSSLARRLDDIQKGLSLLLQKKSYWDAEALKTNLTGRITQEDIAALKLKKNSAVLLGEFRNKNLKVYLKKHPTGRTLSSWTFLLPTQLDDDELKKLTYTIVDTVINDNPYQGLVIGRKGKQVKLNMGRATVAEAGTELELFDFEGSDFSSETQPLGKVKIVRSGKEASIAEIVSREEEIPLYSKVKFSNRSQRSLPGLESKYFDDAWVAGGGDLIFVDSKASSDDPKIKKRLYQLTLTPFLSGRVGYKGLNLYSGVATAENASNKVRFSFFEASYEFLARSTGKWGFITSLGVLYWQVSTDTKPNAELPLVSSSTIAPFLEQTLHYGISGRSRIFATGQLQIPKMSNDDVNGSTQMAGSFGIKGTAGLRLLVSSSFAVENSVNYQYSVFNYSAGNGIGETVFGLNGGIFYRF